LRVKYTEREVCGVYSIILFMKIRSLGETDKEMRKCGTDVQLGGSQLGPLRQPV
jgi:hypothetical protein